MKPNQHPATVVGRLSKRLGSEHVQVRTTAQAIADYVNCMNSETMGIIFGIGVLIGIFVGLVIVYQVLATDVAAHMKEYATFKAMGYSHRFLLGIVFEEALTIAFLGFVPGVALGSGFYRFMAGADRPATRYDVGPGPGDLSGHVFRLCSVRCSRNSSPQAGRTGGVVLMMGRNEPPIQLQSVNHWFGSGETRIQAIFDASLSIERGPLTILRGPSGSGKTTLRTLMGSLRKVQDGSILLLGQELRGASQETQEILRRRLGFIFQAHNLHESLTARQHTLMGLQVHGGRGDAAKQDIAVVHILELLGLGQRIDYLPEKLPGGQKQRVAIAHALVSNPEIVFADEPTAALDKDAGLHVVRILKALGKTRGTSTVMVTHDTRIIELADRIVTIEDGRLVSDRNGIVEASRPYRN